MKWTAQRLHGRAEVAGKRVPIQYVSYEDASDRTATAAIRYLDWPDAGNAGKNLDALREQG